MYMIQKWSPEDEAWYDFPEKDGVLRTYVDRVEALLAGFDSGLDARDHLLPGDPPFRGTWRVIEVKPCKDRRGY